MQMGQFDKAEETYLAHINFIDQLKRPPHNLWVEDWSVRRKDEYAETYVNLGNLRFSRGDLKGAEMYYQKSLGENPDWVNGVKNLAILYSREGRRDAAEAAWRKLQKLAPGDPDVQRVFQLRPPPQQ